MNEETAILKRIIEGVKTLSPEKKRELAGELLKMNLIKPIKLQEMCDYDSRTTLSRHINKGRVGTRFADPIIDGHIKMISSYLLIFMMSIGQK